MNKDLISRQDAIELVQKYHGKMPNEINHQMWKEANDLPSAQPEVIRCKDCKWCEDADGLMCKNPASWVVATDYDFGCVCAERRQDENIPEGTLQSLSRKAS